MKILVLLLILALCSCNSGQLTVVSEQDAGVILDAQVVPVAWNANRKMQVKTDKMLIILSGNYTISLGVRGVIRKMSDNSYYLCVENNLDYCLPMY